MQRKKAATKTVRKTKATVDITELAVGVIQLQAAINNLQGMISGLTGDIDMIKHAVRQARESQLDKILDPDINEILAALRKGKQEPPRGKIRKK